MRQINFLILALLTTFLLNGCAATKNTQDNDSTSTAEAIDPDNESLKTAMQDFLIKSGAPVSSRYHFVRFDMNGDKRREALVIIKNPYGYWCGKDGCPLLVMKANDTGFTLVNAIQPVREPIYISRAKTNDWHNIIVRLSGRWEKSKNVMLRYDGKQYPANPDSLNPYPINPANHPDFVRVLYDEGTNKESN